MKIERICNPKAIVNNPESIHNYFAWPTAARLQNGRIAVVCSGFRLAHICPFGKAVIVYSEDEGETYTCPAPVIDTLLDDRDAGIVTFGDKGVIVTSFNLNWDVYMNGEYTDWYKPYEDYVSAYTNLLSDETVKNVYGSRFCISNNFGISFGEKFQSPITSPHGPTVLRNGSVIWIGNNISYRSALDCQLLVYRLYPDGKYAQTGRIGNVYEDGNKILTCEPHAIELDDGTLLCHIRTHSNKVGMSVFQSESYDGGITWTTPHNLFSEKTYSAPAHLLRHSSGTIISAYGFRGDPPGIRIMMSQDNGFSWEKDHVLFESDCGADLGYPSTVELSDGSLLTVFYAHEKKNGPAVIMQQKWKLVN